VESESSKIGRLYLPSSLWDALKKATILEIQLPIQERVNWLLQEYRHLLDCPELLKNKLKMLKYRYGSQVVGQWHQLIDEERWGELVETLLIHHYDPSYCRSLGQSYSQAVQQINLPNLSPENIDRLIELIFRELPNPIPTENFP
jgi:tRNA 2-selenouridine synthase